MGYISLLPVFLAVAATAQAKQDGVTPTQFGMEMGTRAYEGVCWYEYLKMIPSNKEGFLLCGAQAEHTKEQILKRIPQDEQKGYYKEWMVKTMSHLPSEYGSNCNTHLKSGSADTLDTEGDTILDQGLTTYPFRAFSYCLIKTLGDKYGDKAKTAVRDEKIRGGTKHWLNALNDRENELRARHGSSPLALDRELIERAQRWADQNAANCHGNHISDTHEDYLLQGKATGESLSSGSGKNDEQVNAYRAVNSWYEEINSYPWSEGGLRDPRKQQKLFDAVGHFTQTVWASSKRVGYGYAYNPNCPNPPPSSPGKFFITARYFPAGNYPNEFQDNVKPPKQ